MGQDCECNDGGVTSKEMVELKRNLIIKIRDTEKYLEADTSNLKVSAHTTLSRARLKDYF